MNEESKNGRRTQVEHSVPMTERPHHPPENLIKNEDYKATAVLKEMHSDHGGRDDDLANQKPNPPNLTVHKASYQTSPLKHRVRSGNKIGLGGGLAHTTS